LGGRLNSPQGPSKREKQRHKKNKKTRDQKKKNFTESGLGLPEADYVTLEPVVIFRRAMEKGGSVTFYPRWGEKLSISPRTVIYLRVPRVPPTRTGRRTGIRKKKGLVSDDGGSQSAREKGRASGDGGGITPSLSSSSRRSEPKS